MTMKITRETFQALMEERHRAIGELLFGDETNAQFDDPRDVFMTTIASSAALATAMIGAIHAMRKSGMIPDDLGAGISQRLRAIELDIQKAVLAQLVLDNEARGGTADKVVH